MSREIALGERVLQDKKKQIPQVVTYDGKLQATKDCEALQATLSARLSRNKNCLGMRQEAVMSPDVRS
jgi:hypothetical protein